MKLHELTEMTLRAGDLTHRLTLNLQHAAQRLNKFKHVGDIEDVKVIRLDTEYLLLKGDEPAAFFQVLENPATLQQALVLPEFQRQGMLLRFVHFLKRYLGFTELRLSDVISRTMYDLIPNLLHRFEVSFVNGDEKVPCTPETMRTCISAAKKTGWQLMLENDGDFSSWPLFFDKDKIDLEQFYDWLLEPLDEV